MHRVRCAAVRGSGLHHRQVATTPRDQLCLTLTPPRIQRGHFALSTSSIYRPAQPVAFGRQHCFYLQLHKLSLSLSLSLSHTHTHTLSLSHTHTHTLSLSLSSYCYLNGSLLTSKDLLSIIGSTNTCVPKLSLSLGLLKLNHPHAKGLPVFAASALSLPPRNGGTEQLLCTYTQRNPS